jgi:hypothetical protein
MLWQKKARGVTQCVRTHYLCVRTHLRNSADSKRCKYTFRRVHDTHDTKDQAFKIYVMSGCMLYIIQSC